MSSHRAPRPLFLSPLAWPSADAAARGSLLVKIACVAAASVSSASGATLRLEPQPRAQPPRPAALARTLGAPLLDSTSRAVAGTSRRCAVIGGRVVLGAGAGQSTLHCALEDAQLPSRGGYGRGSPLRASRGGGSPPSLGTPSCFPIACLALYRTSTAWCMAGAAGHEQPPRVMAIGCVETARVGCGVMSGCLESVMHVYVVELSYLS